MKTVPPANLEDLAEAMRQLAPYPFTLHRVAPTTYEGDINSRSTGKLEGLMIRAGFAYRVKIRKGPFFLAVSATEAARLAVADYLEKLAKLPN